MRLSPLYLVRAILGMAASIAFLVGCQSLDSSASSSAVSASWSGGRVFLPRGPWRPFVYIGHNGIAIPGLRIDSGLASKLPAIVYVHASGGIRLADSQFAAQAAEWGYLVFMPDSYARAGRRPNCDGSTLQCGAFPAAFRYRNEEIRYAANRVLELPFVDHRRLFLIGDSEGGLAVANYAGDEFTGIVIGDWDCGGPPYGAIRYALPGIAAPRHVAVLAFVSSEDPWYTPRGMSDCGKFLGGRPNISQSFVVPGYSHLLIAERHIVEATRTFLDAVAASTTK